MGSIKKTNKIEMKYAALAGLLMAGIAAENNDKVSALKYVQIVEGFLDGAADAEGFNDIDKCIKDAEGITDIAEDMIKHFENHHLSDILSGVKDISTLITKISSSMEDCKDGKADWEKLKKMAKTFKNPVSFAWHVGGDIVHNGIKITKEIHGAVNDYKSEKWLSFGK